MRDAEFTALLVEFTATHHCSRNWLETVVEWTRTALLAILEVDSE